MAQALKTTRRLVRSAGAQLAALVFPETCWIEHEPLSAQQAGLSDAVRRRLAWSVLWPYCPLCGATVGRGAKIDGSQPCGQCERRPLGVERIVRAGVYDGPLSNLVRTLKFSGRWELARVLAPFLYQALTLATRDGTFPPVEALVPVALHWRRRWARGFNQSEELAREVARLGGWRVDNALVRVRATMEQSAAHSIAQRRENLRGAFDCARSRGIAGKHIWLIDDVSTTGATIQAAAAALRALPKAQRPAGIYAAVLCVVDRTPIPDEPAA